MSFASQDWMFSWATILVLVISSTAYGKTENNIKTDVFLSPKIVLGPGSVSNKFYYDVDFPRGHIAIKSFNAEIVDEGGKSVPLQEVYLHHWLVVRYYHLKNVTNSTEPNVIVRNSGFCQDTQLGQYYGLGSETRGTATDIPDPFGVEIGNPKELPYGYEEKWIINVHAIDTRGVEDRLGCIECRCDLYNVTKDDNGDPLSPDYGGGLQCCPDESQCRIVKNFQGPKKTFYLKYTVKWINWDNYVVPLRIYIPDVTDKVNISDNGKRIQHNCLVEYDVEQCSKGYKNSSGCVDVRRTSFPVPKNNGGYFIYGVGHLHVGGIASTVYGEDGRVICTSKPIYGNGSEAGNEKGYLVGMSTCYPPPGSIKIKDGETLTLEIIYNNTQRHTGVMGLFYYLLADQLKTA